MDVGRLPGYGLTVKKLIVMVTILCAVLPCEITSASDFETALERARQAGVKRRYHEVIEILAPFNAVGDPEVRYVTAAEIGRAYFHLGRYREAHRAFREAVGLHPERVETAIYLEATSYLVGDSQQAYAILREILRSGARDLYLAVTLPGERQFLADPEVHEILEEFAVTLTVDVERARVLGVGLGDSRNAAVEALGARSSEPTAPSLTASAGPALIWAFAFDAEQRLSEIVLQADNLFRYTPYRLQFGEGLDWKLTPAAAIAAWGPPSDITTSEDEGVVARWDYADHRLTLDFGRLRPPRPPGMPEGAAALQIVQLVRQTEESADRMTQ